MVSKKYNYVNARFKDIVNTVLTKGSDMQARNSMTKRNMNLTATFTKTPLITLRTTAWRNALREFEWFLSGSNNINDLHPKVRPWWIPWANTAALIPNNYSQQFRNFVGRKKSCDQIQYMIDTLIKDPGSRRNVITTWNTADMIDEDTNITNCHGSVIQAFVNPDNTVHLTMYQRSADLLLGVPHNWIQYWAFLHYLAHRSGRDVGSFTWIGGDCHIYESHLEMAKKICNYAADRAYYDIPNLVYTPTSDEFKAEDFSLDAKPQFLIKEKLEMIV